MYIYAYLPVPAPGQPSVNVTAITSTSISLVWSVPSGSVVTSYEVMWQALSSGDGGSGTSGSITSTSYTIQDLESNTVYTVTVTVTNPAGSTVSQPIIITSMWFCHTSLWSDDICFFNNYSVPSVTQSASLTDAATVTGGVVVVVLIIAVTVIVIVILLLRNRRGHYSTGPQQKYVISLLCVRVLW